MKGIIIYLTCAEQLVLYPFIYEMRIQKPLKRTKRNKILIKMENNSKIEKKSKSKDVEDSFDPVYTMTIEVHVRDDELDELLEKLEEANKLKSDLER